MNYTSGFEESWPSDFEMTPVADLEMTPVTGYPEYQIQEDSMPSELSDFSAYNEIGQALKPDPTPEEAKSTVT